MELHFGFSYVGLIYLLMLFLPNLLWTKNQPKDYEKYVGNERRALVILERLGEVLVSCCVLIFSDFNFGQPSARLAWLCASFLLMLGYEVYWIRYFRSGKTLRDFYAPLLGIPVAGATLPVAAFLLLGVYGRNPLLIVSTAILGVGHIGIHLDHLREIETEEKEKKS